MRHEIMFYISLVSFLKHHFFKNFDERILVRSNKLLDIGIILKSSNVFGSKVHMKFIS